MTQDRALSLSWTRPIQSMPQSHCLKTYLNIILPSMPGSSKWSPPLRFPHRKPVHTSPIPTRATCPTHLSLLDLITRIISLVNTQNVSATKIVDSSSIQRAETKYGLRIQFLALVVMIHEVWLNA